MLLSRLRIVNWCKLLLRPACESIAVAALPHNVFRLKNARILARQSSLFRTLSPRAVEKLAILCERTCGGAGEFPPHSTLPVVPRTAPYTASAEVYVGHRVI